MKVLIYCNFEKDPESLCLNALERALDDCGVEYNYIDLDDEIPADKYDAVFVIGGDGTILRRTEYVNKNGIPIVGINAGKLGFLTEFESSEIAEAVNLFSNNKLKEDARSTIIAEFRGKRYYALNDAVIQRLYNDTHNAIITVKINIDGNEVDSVCGDGVIIATPTGSTAYSLSAGGAILAPGINAFLMTPIAAHSFSQRPVVFSSEYVCEETLLTGENAALVIDGKMISVISKGETVKIYKSANPTVFLRRAGFNFFERLTKKMKDRGAN